MDNLTNNSNSSTESFGNEDSKDLECNYAFRTPLPIAIDPAPNILYRVANFRSLFILNFQKINIVADHMDQAWHYQFLAMFPIVIDPAPNIFYQNVKFDPSSVIYLKELNYFVGQRQSHHANGSSHNVQTNYMQESYWSTFQKSRNLQHSAVNLYSVLQKQSLLLLNMQLPMLYDVNSNCVSTTIDEFNCSIFFCTMRLDSPTFSEFIMYAVMTLSNSSFVLHSYSMSGKQLLNFFIGNKVPQAEMFLIYLFVILLQLLIAVAIPTQFISTLSTLLTINE